MAIEVARLQAAFELLDEASPTIDAIEKAMGGLESALGVTRDEVKKTREELEDITKAGEMTEKAIKALGITTEEYFKVLANNQALAKAAEDMDRLQVSALQMNKAFNENAQRSGMAMAGMQEQAIAMDKGMSDALQRSGMEMARLQDEAIAMDKAMHKPKDTALALQVAMGNILSNAIQTGAAKVKNFAMESADLAVRLEMLVNVSRHLGETQGYTAKQIDDMANSIAGLGITSIKSREAINKMVQAGLDLSKSTKLAKLAQDAGTIGNINSSEALERLIHGITTMQTQTLRTVGININAKQAVADYAKEIGKSKDALTAAEKQQAFFNGVLKEGEKIVGSYETRMGTAGGMQLSLVRIQEEAQVQIGNFLKPLKELEVQMETVFWKNVQKYPEAFTILGAALTVVAGGMTAAAFAATTFGVSTMAAAGAAAAWVVAAGPVIITLAAIAAAVLVAVEAWKTYEAVRDGGAAAEKRGEDAYIAQAQALAKLHPEWGFLAEEIDTVNEALDVYRKNQADTNKRMEEGAEKAQKLAEAKAKAADEFFGGVNKAAGVDPARGAIERIEAEIAAERKAAKAAEDREKARKLLKREKTEELTEAEVKIALAAEERAKKTEEAQKKAVKATEDHIKKIKDLQDAYSGGKVQKEVDLIAEALKDLGTNIPKESLDELGAKLKKLAENGAKLNPQLAQIVQNFRLMEAQKILKEAQGPDFLKNKKLGEDLAFSKGTKGGIVQDLTPKALGFKAPDWPKTMAKDLAAMGMPLGDIESRLKAIGAQDYEIAAAMKPVIEQTNGLRAATLLAQQQTAQWGQLFQGLIGLAGMFGETAAAAAQMAGNAFDQFSAAGEKAKSASLMEGGGSKLFAEGGMDALKKKVKGGQGLSVEEMKDFEKGTAEAEAKTAKFNATINAASAVAGMLGDKLMKSTNPRVQKLGGALSGAAAGAKMGAAFGPWGAAVGAIGGAVLGFISKAKKMRAEMKKLKDTFVDSHGGMTKLAEEAKAAGVSIDKAMKAKTPEAMKKAIEDAEKQMAAFKELTDMAGGSLEALKGKAADAGISLQAIWDAKTPEEYLKATEAVKKSLGDWDKANEKLQSAMDKYGISVDQLGPKFRQAGLDKVGLGLLESFSLLKAAGVDVGLITEKMSADMSDYVNRAVAAGSTVPEAMRPMIEEMIKNGDLLDENGKAYDSLADSGITFAQTLEEGIASAVKAIEELVAVLAQGFNIPVNVHEGSGGGGEGGTVGVPGGRAPRTYDENSFAGGSGGFRDFGRGTRATLHGVEGVFTPENMREMFGAAQGSVSTVVNLAISENPMQTAETVEQMRSFTLETVEREVARSLADAIAEGKA